MHLHVVGHRSLQTHLMNPMGEKYMFLCCLFLALACCCCCCFHVFVAGAFLCWISWCWIN